MKVAEIPAHPLLSVSIVVYKTPVEILRRTLESLELAAKPLETVSVTLVDNASGGGYPRQWQQLVASFEQRPGYVLSLLEAGANRGYGAGHNLALESGVGEYHLVLNPDVELDARSLETAIGYLREARDVALLSPFARGSGGRQEFLCKRYPSVLVLGLRAFCPALGERLCPGRMARYEMRELAGLETPVDVPLASGCFMLFRGEQFLRVGAFNERFFLYFEDFDLSLRIGRLGRVRYHPAVGITHHGGYAARKGFRHLWMFFRSGVRFFRQHGWRWI